MVLPLKSDFQFNSSSASCWVWTVHIPTEMKGTLPILNYWKIKLQKRVDNSNHLIL